MKKLSELPMDTYIFVGDAGTLLTKEDYLNTAPLDNSYDGVPLLEAEPLPATFSWKTVIESIGDEQHEDWVGDVLNEIEAYPALAQAAALLNQIFAKHITYYEGDEIENDLKGITPVFVDGFCPICKKSCANGGYGPLKCQCGWVDTYNPNN